MIRPFQLELPTLLVEIEPLDRQDCRRSRVSPASVDVFSFFDPGGPSWLTISCFSLQVPVAPHIRLHVLAEPLPRHAITRKVDRNALKGAFNASGLSYPFQNEASRSYQKPVRLHSSAVVRHTIVDERRNEKKTVSTGGDEQPRDRSGWTEDPGFLPFSTLLEGYLPRIFFATISLLLLPVLLALKCLLCLALAFLSADRREKVIRSLPEHLIFQHWSADDGRSDLIEQLSKWEDMGEDSLPEILHKCFNRICVWECIEWDVVPLITPSRGAIWLYKFDETIVLPDAVFRCLRWWRDAYIDPLGDAEEQHECTSSESSEAGDRSDFVSEEGAPDASLFSSSDHHGVPGADSSTYSA